MFSSEQYCDKQVYIWLQDICCISGVQTTNKKQVRFHILNVFLATCILAPFFSYCQQHCTFFHMFSPLLTNKISYTKRSDPFVYYYSYVLFVAGYKRPVMFLYRADFHLFRTASSSSLLDKKSLLFKPYQYRFAKTYIHTFIKMEPWFLVCFPLTFWVPQWNFHFHKDEGFRK
jgi:hypothetical protein